MAQYQSFPDAAGDSRTLDKLKALHLPSLAGKRFLDVGCNEGFFCGYAAFDGAARVVGIDASAAYIARARRRFPACEFLQQGWEELPEGPFDVILLASALHYAEDQPALVAALVERLAQDGILVLELGIASSPRDEWVRVERGIDQRHFPTMPLLRRVLKDYAWKWMGPSVAQAGDPVARHVIHVSRPRPVAYLLMQPPAFGKTSIAGRLFPKAGVRVVSGDETIASIAKGERAAPEALKSLLSRDYSPFRLDQAIREVFESGLGPQLAALWAEDGQGGDFALDGYVPREWHAQVEAALAAAGYMPVTLSWERVGAGLPSAATTAGRADLYFSSLAAIDAAAAGPVNAGPGPVGAQGFVDEISIEDDMLVVRGWAVDDAGAPVAVVEVKLPSGAHASEAFDRQRRPDVQRHLGLAQDGCGYSVRVPLPPGLADMRKLGEVLQVRVGRPGHLGPALPMAGSLVQRLRQGGR